VIVDGAQYATGEALALLKPIIEAGRVIAYGEAIDGVPKTATEGEALIAALDGLVAPDVVVTPPCKGLRYTHMRTAEADIYVFANEQPEPIEGTLSVAAEGARQWWDPETAAVLDGVPSGALELPKLATRVLCVRREA